MARKPKVEYPGAVYHLMNRGDRREPIFRDDADRQRFINTLGEACGKIGWKVAMAARLRAEAAVTVKWIARATANERAGLSQSTAVSSTKDGRGMSCQYQE